MVQVVQVSFGPDVPDVLFHCWHHHLWSEIAGAPLLVLLKYGIGCARTQSHFNQLRSLFHCEILPTVTSCALRNCRCLLSLLFITGATGIDRCWRFVLQALFLIGAALFSSLVWCTRSVNRFPGSCRLLYQLLCVASTKIPTLSVAGCESYRPIPSHRLFVDCCHKLSISKILKSCHIPGLHRLN